MLESAEVRVLNVLGVIPARGGSKSIPKKNIVDLGGLPLIAYTIKAAKNSALLNDFIVSTDSEDIASIARFFGAVTPFIRPENLSNDFSDSIDVVTHALAFMEKEKKTTYDAVVLLQPTTPFRSASLIDKALRLLCKSQFDSIISVVDVGANHPYRMYTLGKNEQLISFVSDVEEPMMPRQKLPSIFIRSGDIYAVRRSCLMEQNSLIGRNPGGLVVDPGSSINIDEPIDLDLARIKLQSF